jgi:hypothetical protein
MAANSWIQSVGATCRLARYGDEGIELFWPPFAEETGTAS